MRTAARRMTASIRDLSGDSLAIIIVVGLVLGTFPVYGCPTGLCFLTVLLFRLNAPGLHLVNQLASPLQLALIIPFSRVGRCILGSHGAASNSIALRVGELTLQAVAGWLCVMVPLGAVMYIVLSPTLKRRRRGCFDELESPA